MTNEMQENQDWLGKQLGKYKILKLLGRGGMGAVYQAHHTMLEKTVCLKVLSPACTATGPKAIERFLQEARAIAKLEHPNIVKVYDIEQVNNLYFIVMEYIQGKTLSQLLEEKDAFGVRDTVNISIKIAQALDAAHRQRLIHRDVKSANIMVSETGEVKLTDFGLAISVDRSSKISSSNEIWGTPSYLSPETINGDPVDHRTDIYSLGIVVFEMLIGEPPYTGTNPITVLRQHLEAPVPSISQLRPDVPVELEKIIVKMLAKQPQERVQSAEALIALLQHCSSSLSENQKRETVRYYPDKPGNSENDIEQKADNDNKANKVRVLVVDDSPVMCKAISNILKASGSCEVAGVAHNGKEALELIPQLNPDVITLDFNMSEMDGTTTLKQIMTRYPRPVIMLSAFTYEGAWASFDCLSYGAVDFIWKSSKSYLNEFKRDLLDKILKAAKMQLHMQPKPKIAKMFNLRGQENTLAKPAQWAVVISSGQGGYHTVLKIIPYIPKNIPCALILLQEMPDEMTDTFGSYLDQYSRVTVKQIEDHALLNEGVCYVGNHILSFGVQPDSGGGFKIVREKLANSDTSVFQQTMAAVAAHFGHHAIAVALTGEIKGAIKGLKQIKEVGGTVIVQDPVTCFKAATVNLAIQEKIADKIVKDIDIPSVLWYVLKKHQEKEAKLMAAKC
jgi:chemotaxis response regulator CheB/predicted Ser/Thr protein kinase